MCASGHISKRKEGLSPVCQSFNSRLTDQTSHFFSSRSGGRGANEGTFRDEECHPIRARSRWKPETGERYACPTTQVCYLECFWFSELTSVANALHFVLHSYSDARMCCSSEKLLTEDTVEIR